MKRTAVGTWAFIWGGYREAPIPFRTAIEKMAALKYDGIELGAFAPHLEPNTKEKRKELKNILDDNRLSICGVAAPFPSPATSKPEASLDVVKLDSLVSHTFPLADAAQAIRKLRDRVGEPMKVQISL